MTRRGSLSRIWEGDEESDSSLRHGSFRCDDVSSESSLYDEDMHDSFYPSQNSTVACVQ